MWPRMRIMKNLFVLPVSLSLLVIGCQKSDPPAAPPQHIVFPADQATQLQQLQQDEAGQRAAFNKAKSDFDASDHGKQMKALQAQVDALDAADKNDAALLTMKSANDKFAGDEAQFVALAQVAAQRAGQDIKLYKPGVQFTSGNPPVGDIPYLDLDDSKAIRAEASKLGPPAKATKH